MSNRVALGSSQLGSAQFGRSRGVGVLSFTDPNYLSILSSAGYTATFLKFSIPAVLWVQDSTVTTIHRAWADNYAVAGIQSPRVAATMRQFSSPSLFVSVMSRGLSVPVVIGKDLLSSLVSIVLPYWTETRHSAPNEVDVLSDASSEFAYYAGPRNWTCYTPENFVSVLSKTVLKRAWVPTAKGLICNIYDASIWTRDLVAPYRFLVTNIQDQSRIWRAIVPPALSLVASIQEQMRAWRTIKPLTLVDALGVMSGGLLSAWNPTHSILEANIASVLEPGEGIRFVLGNDVTGIVLAIGSFSPHYATVGENLVDIYQVGLLSMVRNAPQRSLLLYIMEGGAYQSLQWLKQIDTGEAWENQEDVLASWIHQEDVAVTVPSRFHRQGTAASTFKAQEDGTSIFKN